MRGDSGIANADWSLWRPELGFKHPGDMLPDQDGFTAVMVGVCRGYNEELGKVIAEGRARKCHTEEQHGGKSCGGSGRGGRS